jgi:hypothetical protein
MVQQFFLRRLRNTVPKNAKSSSKTATMIASKFPTAAWPFELQIV